VGNGFHLEAQGYADDPAPRIAVKGDAADIAVADWIRVARQEDAAWEGIGGDNFPKIVPASWASGTKSADCAGGDRVSLHCGVEAVAARLTDLGRRPQRS
jgi:hypothetical protein